MTEPRATRLLVIDDDESLLEVFQLTMTREGFEVAEAADGLKGLAKIAVFKPDVIVLDLMMPNLNGFETIHRLQREGFGNIPVIVITGYSDRANVHILRQEPNVVEFLVKPIDYASLAASIRKLLA